MRILLVHPQDSPRCGPWTHQRWDLIVDLGKSSDWSANQWAAQYGCPVIRSSSYRQAIEDVHLVRQILLAGRGRLIDEEGIDWWELASLALVPEMLELVAMRRLQSAIPRAAELWVTRRGGAAHLLAILLERDLRAFTENRLDRAAALAAHYMAVARKFSPSQMREIFFDKYDPRYRWRSIFAHRKQTSGQSVVLIPSAYINVSRMAAAYARLLPQQEFLIIATRPNAKNLVLPRNVRVWDLAAYADPQTPLSEISLLLQRWSKLEEEMASSPDLRVLSQAGILDSMPDWIRNGVSVRDAWLAVLHREPVRAVLCGDDSNRYTRLPVLLAAKQKIPTVDFHHGAFDGFYLMKELRCDIYLAKNGMERDYLLRLCGLPDDRIVVAAPAPQYAQSAEGNKNDGAVVMFSEPYDVLGMRPEEVYRELMPPLCRLAREHAREVIVKLHPFESRPQRNRLLREILAPEDFRLIRIVDGPLTRELMANAWFGVTVESTTVLDCLQDGVACFLCGWLKLSPYGYVEQFARFGVGDVLESVEQIAGLPGRVEEFHTRAANPAALWETADRTIFEQWLTYERDHSNVRALS
jgi:hypothetical protein